MLELNVNGFGSYIAQQLTGNCKGYSLELRHNGVTVLAKSWGDAVDGQLDGGSSLPWTPDINMNIASCSKLITAMALTKILNESPLGMSPDNPIQPYLPSYWNPGLNVELITFADVMTHTSGLKPGPSGFSQTYVPCREAVEAGVIASNLGNHWDYQNTNFLLCRILMATVTGAVSVGMTYKRPPNPPDGSPVILSGPGGSDPTPEQANDALWDYETINFYDQYVQEHIFTPAAVSATPETLGVCGVPGHIGSGVLFLSLSLFSWRRR
jgi:Beta-lactamase